MISEKNNVSLEAGSQRSEYSHQDSCDHNNEAIQGWWRRFFLWLTGWPGLARSGIIVCSFTLLLNLAILAAGKIQSKNYNTPGPAFLYLFEGECEISQKIFTGSHFIINVLSTALLAASGACIQALGAPNEDDIKKAHTRHHYMCIGIFDMRNLLQISKGRILIIIFLAISTVPLHLFYNSVIFQSYFEMQYATYGVFSNFITGDSFDVETAFDVMARVQADSGETMLPACTFLDVHRKLLHDLQHRAAMYDGLFDCNATQWYKSDGSSIPIQVGPPFSDAVLLISNRINKSDSVFSYSAHVTIGRSDVELWPYWFDGLETVVVDRCLARPFTPPCAIILDQTNLVIVIACNALKLACMIFCLRYKEHKPLMTFGDAISAFLRVEDSSTKSYSDLPTSLLQRTLRLHRTAEGPSYLRVESKWRGNYFWLYAPRVVSWVIPTMLWIAMTVFLNYQIRNWWEMNANGFGNDVQKWLLYFSDPRRDPAIIPRNISDSLMQQSLLVNIPQAVLSIMYLGYNNALTVMVMSAEYSRFAKERRTLRVSRPVGDQRSSLQLNIPLKYALTNMTAWAVLHWLASQMMFVTIRRITSTYGNSISGPHQAWISFSPPAERAFIALGSIIVALTLIVGLRRLPRGIPLVSTNSIAIASMCHPGPEEPTNAAELPLMYGKRQNAEGGWVYSFSAQNVEPVAFSEQEDELTLNNQSISSWLRKLCGTTAAQALQWKILHVRQASGSDKPLLELFTSK